MATKEALVIGINQYDDAPVLRYAINDANEFASAIEMVEYNFVTQKLLDDDASANAIRQAVDALLSGPADIKLIFFAGHGYADENGAYLASADISDEESGVSLDWVRERLLASDGTVILILDCCHAGAADVRSMLNGIRAVAEVDVDRSFSTLGSGKIVLAACAEDETTSESVQFSHGIFTFHLLEGLIGPAANFQGVITPFGLFDYIAGKFEDDGLNKPIFKGEQAGTIILGTGFSPIAGLNVPPGQNTGLTTDQDLFARLELEADRLLNEYLAQASVPYEIWRTDGYLRATQLLEPMLRWFERTVSETPEILSSQKFSNAYSEAQARLTQLGAVSEGTFTREGELVKSLGSGAFGTVWQVNASDGKALAYKINHSMDLALKEKVARFERGYRAMRQLEHPHIVKVHSYTQCPLGFYMDFVDGPNLRELGNTVTDTIEVLELLIKIAETLRHAHGRNVIHRDVKPENIVLTYDPNSNNWAPYLTDFDLSWFSSATQLTKEAFGAVFYASPEQLTKPSSHLAHATTTDVYSFGQLCFFVATGSDPVPFGGADNLTGLRNRIGDWGVAEAANTFAELYANCTEHEPKDRVQEFRTISDALFKSLTLIRDADVEADIDSDRFLRELAYALVGLSDHQNRIEEPFNSLSGRSLITITDARAARDRLSLTVRIDQGLPFLSGATAESARRMLNISIDRAMQTYPNVTRRPGSEGAYQAFLDIRDIETNLRGVDLCRSILARAIDAIESR